MVLSVPIHIEFMEKALDDMTPIPTPEIVFPTFTPRRKAGCPPGYVLEAVPIGKRWTKMCVGKAGFSAAFDPCPEDFAHDDKAHVCRRLSCQTDYVSGREKYLKGSYCVQKPTCPDGQSNGVKWTYRNNRCFRNCPHGFELRGEICQRNVFRRPICENDEHLENGLCYME